MEHVPYRYTAACMLREAHGDCLPLEFSLLPGIDHKILFEKSFLFYSLWRLWWLCDTGIPYILNITSRLLLHFRLVCMVISYLGCALCVDLCLFCLLVSIYHPHCELISSTSASSCHFRASCRFLVSLSVLQEQQYQKYTTCVVIGECQPCSLSVIYGPVDMIECYDRATLTTYYNFFFLRFWLVKGMYYIPSIHELFWFSHWLEYRTKWLSASWPLSSVT